VRRKWAMRSMAWALCPTQPHQGTAAIPPVQFKHPRCTCKQSAEIESCVGVCKLNLQTPLVVLARVVARDTPRPRVVLMSTLR